jgi:hypothetical protein
MKITEIILEVREDIVTELVGIKNKIADLPPAKAKFNAAGSIMPLGKKWEDRLRENGFIELGHGGYGSVWEHPNLTYVLKVFNSKDWAYTKWAETCLRNKQNDNLPKFISPKIIKVTPEVNAIRMERLKPLNRSLYRLVDDIYRLFSGFDDDVAEFGSDSDRGKKLRSKFRVITEYCNAHDRFYDTLLFIRNFVDTTPGIMLDLHGGNYMMRGDVLVFTDPVMTESP